MKKSEFFAQLRTAFAGMDEELIMNILSDYKSRAGKPRNFLQLSDNDVEFCRNVVQATARFVLVSLCVV